MKGLQRLGAFVFGFWQGKGITMPVVVQIFEGPTLPLP